MNKTQKKRLLSATRAAAKSLSHWQKDLSQLEHKQIKMQGLGQELFAQWDVFFQHFDQKSQNMLRVAELVLRQWQNMNALPGSQNASQGQKRDAFLAVPEFGQQTSQPADGLLKSETQISALLARAVQYGMRNL